MCRILPQNLSWQSMYIYNHWIRATFFLIKLIFLYKFPIIQRSIFLFTICKWIRQILLHSVTWYSVLSEIYAFAQQEGEGALNDINCHTYIGRLLPNYRLLLVPSISHTSLSVLKNCKERPHVLFYLRQVVL